MGDHVEHLGDVRIAAHARESDERAARRVGGDVVVADPQHLEGLRRRSPLRAVPADDPVEVVQLTRIDRAVFREGHVGVLSDHCTM